MKQSPKNEIDIVGLINQLQEQIVAIGKKIDTLLPQKPPVNSTTPAKAVERNKERQMFKAICADCNKECTIPFKPSPDRPVYCQDCFSRRKVIRLSGMTPPPAAKETIKADTPLKTKKKTAAPKKAVTKKKSTPKKK